jgi:hypothetical protein
MRRRGRSLKPPRPNMYSGPTTCLRCDAVFESWDRRHNRICESCREAMERDPSDEPSYPLLTPRRHRHMDEG